MRKISIKFSENSFVCKRNKHDFAKGLVLCIWCLQIDWWVRGSASIVVLHVYIIIFVVFCWNIFVFYFLFIRFIINFISIPFFLLHFYFIIKSNIDLMSFALFLCYFCKIKIYFKHIIYMLRLFYGYTFVYH